MWRTSVAVLVVSLVGLAGCGGSDGGATTGPEVTAAAATTPVNEVTTTSTETTTSAATTSTEPTTSTSSTSTTTTTTAPVDSAAPSPSVDEMATFTWQQVSEAAPWSARAGLRVVELGDRLLLLGGRTPNQSTIPGDSTIWADVWESLDGGATWTQIVVGDEPGMWPARAYFQAVVKDGAAFVIGGQNFGLEPNPFCALLEQGLEPPPGLGIDPDAPCPEFLPTSDFFNDVWRSTDGVNWEQMTAAAPWDGRAGLSAAVVGDHIYVLGGSKNDDASIVGAGGPARLYFNDVWRSTDGAEWELMTDTAPWEPRAGAATVVQGDRLFVLGGEDGFTCEPLPDCEPPYFNDVWSTTDGTDWTLVSEAAAWSPRPGHVCEPIGDQIVCFGGFGLEVNPTDVWVSADGVEWTLMPGAPWNAADPTEIKYDFDALTIGDGDGERILTVGGDRETFDFADPENYLRVDNDVWVFALPS